MPLLAAHACAAASLDETTLRAWGLWPCLDARLEPGGELVARVSATRSADVVAQWHRIAGGFADHGLWPLVFDTLRRTDDRPWFSGELEASPSSADAHDPTTVLRTWWSAVVPAEQERSADALQLLQPFDRTFPGLADATRGPEDPAAFTLAIGAHAGRLGVVGVTRPADVVAALGWQGPVNHYGDMGALAAVLRSWEDRFGATVIGIGFDTLTLAVTRPPRSLDHAHRIAAEHMAVCMDCIYQGSGTIDEHAHSLVGATTWSFWWD
ncbi:MAG: DUF4253 domain-containing protein [Nannocystaceae bacterium]|nr:DUF4253 domain-containing protein [Nannocystaceae bacterium]